MGQLVGYKNISVQMILPSNVPWTPIIIAGQSDDNVPRFAGIDYANVDTLNVATSDLLDIFNIQGSSGMIGYQTSSHLFWYVLNLNTVDLPKHPYILSTTNAHTRLSTQRA